MASLLTKLLPAIIMLLIILLAARRSGVNCLKMMGYHLESHLLKQGLDFFVHQIDPRTVARHLRYQLHLRFTWFKYGVSSVESSSDGIRLLFNVEEVLGELFFVSCAILEKQRVF